MSDNKSKPGSSTVIVGRGLGSGGAGFVGGGEVHFVVAGSAAFGNGAGPATIGVSQHMEGLQAELRAQRLRADTAEADRDAEKDMKAKAREQRDQVTKKLAAAEQRIAELEKDAERWKFFSTLANELQAFPHSWGKMTPEKMNYMCDEAMRAALNPNPEAESHE